MYYNKLKKALKKQFPFFVKKLILIRDSSNLMRFIKNFFFINLKKNIHGKKIVSREKGILFDFSISNFVSFVIRPKKASDVIIEKESYLNKDTAIIIQGNLDGLKNFVKETIEIYLKLFQSSTIILSTWDTDIDEKFLNDYKDKIKIIINKKPKNVFHSTDLQTISTQAAVKLAKGLDLKFCLKSRTDCRIYKKNTVTYLKNLLNLFPINSNYENLKSRIISCSVDTRKYRVYGFSDIMLFGSTENIGKYFSNESFEEGIKKHNFGDYPSTINETAVVHEIFLCARFLKDSNITINWTLEDWWNKCRDIFCVVDPSTIDLFWFKFHWKYEQRFLTNYTSDFTQSLQFSDWLNLYSDKNYKFDENKKEKWKIENGLFTQ